MKVCDLLHNVGRRRHASLQGHELRPLVHVIAQDKTQQQPRHHLRVSRVEGQWYKVLVWDVRVTEIKFEYALSVTPQHLQYLKGHFFLRCVERCLLIEKLFIIGGAIKNIDICEAAQKNESHCTF